MIGRGDSPLDLQLLYAILRTVFGLQNINQMHVLYTLLRTIIEPSHLLDARHFL